MTRSRADRRQAGLLIAAAAGFAAAELAAGLLIGQFFRWGRAEGFLFLAFRPWLLLAGGLIVAGFGWKQRAAFYAVALLLAGLSEALLLLELGGTPWTSTMRGWAAGAALAAPVDLALQLGRRVGGRPGLAVASGAVILLLVLPGVLRPYESLVLGSTGEPPVAERPRLLLMTGLPIVWGEGGAFDPSSRPAAALGVLEREFDVVMIDYLDARGLDASRLLLLAQPRLLEPVELVALDDWVRGGGSVLILADPDLIWPTDLPLGDFSRPPPTSLLSPLLHHWGLRLQSSERALRVDHVLDRGHLRRLVTAAPGRFSASTQACRLAARGLVAYCRVGAGRAILVADADLLNDVLWVAPGPQGADRHRRLADNPLLVASWLDRLDGRQRERSAAFVIWQRPHSSRARALLLAAIPILLALGAAVAAILRRGWIHPLIHRPKGQRTGDP